MRRLDRVVPAEPGRPEVAGPDHPMRKVTRQVAFDPAGWTPERAAKVTALFDGMSSDWNTRFGDNRLEALSDALERGGVPAGGTALDVGAGTGLAMPVLAGHARWAAALDISLPMVRQVPPGVGARVQADAARLPVRDHAADVVLLFNAFLFPAEVDRVLAPDGVLIWVNALGEYTPIHLPPQEVEAALPGDWDTVTADAGWGTWAVLRRRSSA